MPTPMSTMAVLLTSKGWVCAHTRTKPSRAPLHGVLRTPAKKPMPTVPAIPEAVLCRLVSADGSDSVTTSSMTNPKRTIARNRTTTAVG